MRVNKKQKEFLAYINKVYQEPIGILCNEVNQSRGDAIHPVLFSILCDRVSVSECETQTKYKIKRKIIKRENYHKHRRS